PPFGVHSEPQRASLCPNHVLQEKAHRDYVKDFNQIHAILKHYERRGVYFHQLENPAAGSL
ncbi:MAG: hypothetical protein AAGC97_05840, partial [Planctomycetota bacterium]